MAVGAIFLPLNGRGKQAVSLSATERRIIGQFSMSAHDFEFMKARCLVFGGGLKPAQMSEIMAAVKRRQARRPDDNLAYREPPRDMHEAADEINGDEHINAQPPKTWGMVKFAPLPKTEEVDGIAKRWEAKENDRAIRQIHASLNAIERRR
ncbi:MAG: hypothetical protein JO166_18490 [Deltaproteobacteria bacterium]|nr:hypothetical protein [Deltaproteobacteria bacterium]